MTTYTENNVNYSYTVGNSDATVIQSSNASGTVAILGSFVVDSVTYIVTTIGEGAFYGCSGLTSITIPSSVTSIGSIAFYNCSGLTSITIPNSVTSLGESVFRNCSGLTSITIPNSVTFIDESAFYGCSGLTSITIPNSVTRIESALFSNCSSLTSITIPNSVTSIGNYPFRKCSGLTSVTLPSSFTSLGQNVFWGCYNIQTINNVPITVSWHSISMSIPNYNATFFSGFFTTFDITNTTIINAFYTSSDLTTNILAHTSDDNGADFLFNNNSFSYNGTTITSIPALEMYFNDAQEWKLQDDYGGYFLRYKNSANQWISFPDPTVFTINSITDPRPPPPTLPAQPTITNIRSTRGVTSISFQNPSDTSITNYAYSTINVLDIENSVLPPFSSYTLLSPAQTTSPLTINGLHGVVQIKIKAFNGSYSDESTAVNNWYEPPFV